MDPFRPQVFLPDARAPIEGDDRPLTRRELEALRARLLEHLAAVVPHSCCAVLLIASDVPDGVPGEVHTSAATLGPPHEVVSILSSWIMAKLAEGWGNPPPDVPPS